MEEPAPLTKGDSCARCVICGGAITLHSEGDPGRRQGWRVHGQGSREAR